MIQKEELSHRIESKRSEANGDHSHEVNHDPPHKLQIEIWGGFQVTLESITFMSQTIPTWKTQVIREAKKQERDLQLRNYHKH